MTVYSGATTSTVHCIEPSGTVVSPLSAAQGGVSLEVKENETDKQRLVASLSLGRTDHTS
ncbi:hypothetical protein RRG08_064331 [Elysia crispata]|uniref:Uncharacterized protein n=1 Tax=Elysia crispata TaxID=231223 RepID=A0AAE1EAU2_9GAST|nr:hypothetical protein RRG08_064331 [Elysia crispata]